MYVDSPSPNRPQHRVTTIGPLQIDHDARTATVRGAEVRLRNQEWKLLIALATDPTRVFTKQELLRDVWGYRATPSTRTVDAHAVRVRLALRAAGADLLVTVWGVGYRLVDGV